MPIFIVFDGYKLCIYSRTIPEISAYPLQWLPLLSWEDSRRSFLLGLHSIILFLPHCSPRPYYYRSLLFGTADVIDMLGEADHIIIDGTFKTAPDLFTQSALHHPRAIRRWLEHPSLLRPTPCKSSWSTRISFQSLTPSVCHLRLSTVIMRWHFSMVPRRYGVPPPLVAVIFTTCSACGETFSITSLLLNMLY